MPTFVRTASSAEVIWTYIAHQRRYGKGKFSRIAATYDLDAAVFPDKLNHSTRELVRDATEIAKVGGTPSYPSYGDFECLSKKSWALGKFSFDHANDVWSMLHSGGPGTISALLPAWKEYLSTDEALKKGESQGHAAMLKELTKGLSFSHRPILWKHAQLKGKLFVLDGRHRIFAATDHPQFHAGSATEVYMEL